MNINFKIVEVFKSLKDFKEKRYELCDDRAYYLDLFDVKIITNKIIFILSDFLIKNLEENLQFDIEFLCKEMIELKNFDDFDKMCERLYNSNNI